MKNKLENIYRIANFKGELQFQKTNNRFMSTTVIKLILLTKLFYYTALIKFQFLTVFAHTFQLKLFCLDITTIKLYQECSDFFIWLCHFFQIDAIKIIKYFFPYADQSFFLSLTSETHSRCLKNQSSPTILKK